MVNYTIAGRLETNGNSMDTFKDACIFADLHQIYYWGGVCEVGIPILGGLEEGGMKYEQGKGRSG